MTPEAGVRAYVGPGGLPQTEVPAITENSLVLFYDVPPGEHTFRVKPPAGVAGIDCSATQTGAGGATAWPTGAPNEFRMRAEAGHASASFVFCTVRR